LAYRVDEVLSRRQGIDIDKDAISTELLLEPVV
jgi:hypothetical protein